MASSWEQSRGFHWLHACSRSPQRLDCELVLWIGRRLPWIRTKACAGSDLDLWVHEWWWVQESWRRLIHCSLLHEAEWQARQRMRCHRLHPLHLQQPWLHHSQARQHLAAVSQHGNLKHTCWESTDVGEFLAVLDYPCSVCRVGSEQSVREPRISEASLHRICLELKEIVGWVRWSQSGTSCSEGGSWRLAEGDCPGDHEEIGSRKDQWEHGSFDLEQSSCRMRVMREVL